MPVRDGSELRGASLPGGTFRLEAADHEELCSAVGAAPPADGSAHPIALFVATQRGMGLDLEQLLQLCDASPDDGPMLGACNMRFAGRVEVGVEYEVRATIDDVVRKHGRRTGVFDMVTYECLLIGPAGDAVASCTRSLILPRRDSGAS